MKKNTKKILSYSILGLFLFAFAMQFVAADPTDSIKDWFTKWESGDNQQFSSNIAKYLLWALVSIVIFSVAKFIPGFSGKSMKIVRWAFAIIAGFLSMAYITPEEVYGIMVSYSALGFTLGIAMPFVILILFTFQLSDFKGMNTFARVGNQVLAVLLWAVFAVFAVLKAIGAPDDSKGVSWIVAVLAILMAITVKSIMIYIWSQAKGENISRVKEKHAKIRVVEDERAKAAD